MILNFSLKNGIWKCCQQSVGMWGQSMGFILCVNTLRPRQNGRHFTDDIFKCIFLNENVWIPIEISLKFVLKGLINNIAVLVQIMAWCRPGDKPLSNQWWLVYWRIYVSLGLNELKDWSIFKLSSSESYILFWWLSSRLQYLKYLSTGDTAVLH